MPPHRITRAVAGALALAALAAPSAQAGLCNGVCGAATPTPSAALPPPVTRAIDHGFDWGSAGFGAGVGTAIVLLLIAGVRAGARASPRPLR